MYSDKVQSRVQYDIGLRQFMLSVFNNMAVGLAISAIVAFLVGTNSQLLMLLFSGPQKWVVLLAPLAMVFWISFRIQYMSLSAAWAWFYTYAAVMGLSLATIFVVYKVASIATVFFASSAMFGAFSIYGATTKQDLTKFGSFLIMGLIGVIVAGLINLFVQSSIATTVISMISVVIFAGLTAYDVQQLQAIYDSFDGEERDRLGILGALTLYLDFVNIFLNLLQLFGEKD